jgi:hypothetical protein
MNWPRVPANIFQTVPDPESALKDFRTSRPRRRRFEEVLSPCVAVLKPEKFVPYPKTAA